MEFDEEKNETISKTDEDVHVEKDTDSSSQSTDRFTQLMFGNRIPNKYRDKSNSQEQKEKEEEQHNNEANYFTLIEQIDDIMGSIEKLKPVLKEFAPIVDYFKKKI